MLGWIFEDREEILRWMGGRREGGVFDQLTRILQLDAPRTGIQQPSDLVATPRLEARFAIEE